MVLVAYQLSFRNNKKSGDVMPFIQINMLEGRSDEKKEALISEVTHTVAKVLDAPIETIRVMIHEMPETHWGIAGESVKKRRETKV
ncbi:4-oxalocrotonate tautomerase [Microbacteriaceae bacterium 4G12]